MAWIPRTPSTIEEYLIDETGDIIMFEDGEGFLIDPSASDNNWDLVIRE